MDPIETFAKRVEEESGGRVEIELFHSGQLFGGKEEFGAVERGDVDMSASLDIYHTGKVPALGVTSLPFLWTSPASLQKTLDAGLYDQGLTQALAEHNMVVLDEAGAQRSEDQLQRLQDFLDEAVAQFRDHGVKVHEVTDTELEAFKNQVAPVYDWWQGEVDGGDKLVEFA